jgi:membrane-associated phospholipid phosphatase
MVFKDFLKIIDEWDQKIILKYNGIGGRPFTYLLKILSFLGRETLWIFLIAFYLFVWYDPYLLSNLGSIFFVGLFIIVPIKKVVNRSRPFDKLENSELKVLEMKPSSKSFPSWHSYNITAYGLLFGSFFLKSPLITIVMQLLAVIVSFSRIQLGVHYPSDVIFGYFIGILGFSISILFIAPVFQMIIEYFEQFTLHSIEYRQISSFLLKNIWYIMLWVIICIAILLSATYKHIQDKFIRREMKD